ncbi:MAG: hypothetical protein AAFQ08_02120 [Bacteroidota bacterium]
MLLFGLWIQPYEARGQSTTPQQVARVVFPRTVQVTPYIGFTTNEIPQRVKRAVPVLTLQRLSVLGLSADLSVLQIRKFLWKHFHCYPQLGIQVHYGRLENKGNLVGGTLYVAPQHDYQASFEFFPRLGVGLYYAHIPGKNLEKVKKTDKKSPPPPDIEVKDFIKNVGLDLSLTLIWKIKFNPHWILSPSLGFNYVPYFSQEDPKLLQVKPTGSKDLRFVTLGLGLSYTFNPSEVRYPSPSNLQINRVDIGMLHGFKKYRVRPLKASEKPSSNKNGKKKDARQYYYLGGIYGHWSLRVTNSHAITLATEWVKDWAAKEAIKDLVRKGHLKISFLIGHEFLWGKLIFGQQLGLHVLNNADHESPLYGRLGLEYRITEHFFVGLSAKISPNIRFQGIESVKELRTRIFNNSMKEGQKPMYYEPYIDCIDFRIGYSF